MKIIPAIDIRDGKCVRLIQGDFAKETIFSTNPVSVAKQWEEQGAEVLHVVDLDGAKGAVMKNFDVIENITKSIHIPIQVGGGIRNEKTMKQLLDIGVKKVILGTLVLEDQNIFQDMLGKFEKKIIVALDAKNGKLVSRGWTQETNKDVFQIIKKLEELKISECIYTDVLKDGTMSSPNGEMITLLLHRIRVKLIISGGISSTDDLRKLKKIGVSSVIVGRALYEGRISLC